MEYSATLVKDVEDKDTDFDCVASADEFDNLLDDLGSLSRFQLLLIACGTLLMFSGFTVTTLPVFLSASPDFRCTDAISSVSAAATLGNNRTITATPSNKFDKVEKISKCSRITPNLTQHQNNISTTVYLSSITSPSGSICDNYTYDRSVYKETITSEWNLVCERRMLKALANSCMFIGFFFGSLTSGAIGDRFGRRIGLLVMAVLTGVFSVAASLSQNYITYLICFAILSGGSIGQVLLAFTYMSEISNRKRRDDVMTTATLVAIFGDVLISPVAAIFRHWRYILQFCATVALMCVPVCYFMVDSPRYLLTAGKEKDARQIVEKFFKSKNMTIDESRWARVAKAERVKRLQIENADKRSISDLFKYHNIRLLTLNVMACWFIVSMVYYGLILNIGNLSGNPYINGTINSMLDIISSISLLFLLRICVKTKLMSGSFFLAGLGCIGSMLVLQAGYAVTSVVLACFGRFAASCAYKVAYMLTAEVYPTVLRSSGMSLGSGASRIGGMISPFAVEAQETAPWIMQTLFGSLSFVAGILSLAFPNTKHIGLMSSVDEVEEFCSEQLPRLCRRKSATNGRRFTSVLLTSDGQKPRKEL